MSIFGPKRVFWDLNWPKMGQTGFFGQNPKMSLPPHQEAPTLCQISENSYERILRSLRNACTHVRTDVNLQVPLSIAGNQKSAKFNEPFGRYKLNFLFWAKTGKFEPKRPQNGWNQIFTEDSLGYFINRPKMQFKHAKLRRSYDSFSRNWPKCPFLGQNVHFDLNWPKTGQTGFFGQNSKMSLPSHQEAPTLSQISENSYERILRSLSNVRTYARTYVRTDARTDVNLQVPLAIAGNQKDRKKVMAV